MQRSGDPYAKKWGFSGLVSASKKLGFSSVGSLSKGGAKKLGHWARGGILRRETTMVICRSSGWRWWLSSQFTP
jgi:hypothetical protein